MNILKYIFLLFHCDLVFAIPKFKKSSKNKIISLLIFFFAGIFVSLMHISITVTEFVSISMQSRTIGNFFMNFVTAVFRLVLCWKLKSLENLCNKLTSSFYISNMNKKSKIYFYLSWMIYIVVSDALLTILSLFASIKYATKFSELLLKDSENTIFFYAFVLVYVVSFILFSIMPMHVFMIYYSFICSQLKDVLDSFIKTLRNVSVVDYSTLYKQTIAIEKIFCLANKNLDFLVFISVLFNSANMYYIITVLLHRKLYPSYLHITTIYLLCSSTFISFLIMITSAVEVNDQSAEISALVKELPVNNNSKTRYEMRFYFCMLERDMNLKIWGVGPIKKSFIIGAFGTIFTYCILVNGIWESKELDNDL